MMITLAIGIHTAVFHAESGVGNLCALNIAGVSHGETTSGSTDVRHVCVSGRVSVSHVTTGDIVHPFVSQPSHSAARR